MLKGGRCLDYTERLSRCRKIRCTVREKETNLVYDHPENGGSMLLEMSVLIYYPVRCKNPKDRHLKNSSSKNLKNA
jgi:hypothetical protein